jgi:hypothetical protein
MTPTLATWTQNSYAVISRVLAVVLIVASALKFHAAIVSSQADTYALLIPSLEALFGVWLLLGAYPRFSRCLALGCFVGFLNVATFYALQGAPSCGCFGSVPSTPAIAIVIDVIALVALLLTRVQHPTGTMAGSRRRAFVFGTACSLVAIALILIVMRGQVLFARASVGPESLETRDVIAELLAGINANNEPIQTVQFAADRLIENSKIEKEERIVTERPKGGKSILIIAPRSTLRYDFVLSGVNFRRRQLQDGKVTEEVIVSQGYALTYASNTKRGWLRESPDVEVDPIDPRCMGFDPGTKNVAAWLQELQTKDVRRIDSDVLIKGRDKRGQDVSALFAASRSFLPVKTEYLYGDGTIRTATSISHDKLPGTQSWFLKSAVRLDYVEGDARTSDSSAWITRSTLRTTGTPKVNGRVDPEIFDPILPAGAIVQNLKGKNIRMPAGVRVFRLTDESYRRGGARQATKWSVLAGLNGVVVAACLMFRKRLLA